MKKQILLGKGFFNWPSAERRSDRYGTVWLLNEEDEETVLPMNRELSGKKGKLIVHILRTRQSSHIGDLFRGIFPQMPRLGEDIELGEGTLFFEECKWGFSVGLKPDDERGNDWLDPKKLYRCHDQFVELYFEQERWAMEHPCRDCSEKNECFESFDCEECSHYVGVTEFDEEPYPGEEVAENEGQDPSEL